MRETRRDWLARCGRGAAMAGASLLAARVGAAEPPRTSLIVDTHLHCFAGADDARFPYHERAPYRPEKPSGPDRLLKLMDAAGVDFAVVVHPEPYQDDHRYLEHCLDVGKERLKGTCLFFADRPGAREAMRALVRSRPGRIVAARIHAYALDRLPPFDKPELGAFWKAAADLGLAVQLHFEPRYAPGFEPLIREFPKTPVIIDHLGRPMQGMPDENAAVVAWSRYPNTVMKLSALPDEAAVPPRELAVIVRRIADAFGPERLISGGGYDETATAVSYRAARERIATLLDHFSADDRAKVLGANAARLYGFK